MNYIYVYVYNDDVLLNYIYAMRQDVKTNVLRFPKKKTNLRFHTDHISSCHFLQIVFTASRKVVDYWLASWDTSTCCIFFLNHALVFTAFSPPKMNPHFDERFCTFLYCTNWGSASIIAPYTSPHHINPGWIMAPHWTGAHISWLQQISYA